MEEKKLTGYPSIDKPWLKYYRNENITKPFPKMTLFEYLVAQNSNHLNETALVYFGRKFTYEELFSNIRKTAMAFVSIGVKVGDVVSVCSSTMPEAIFVYYALSTIGAISNMIDPRTNPKGIQAYLKETESKVLVVVDVFMPKIVSILPGTEVKTIIQFSPSESFPFTLRALYGLSHRSKCTYESSSNGITTYGWKEFLKNSENTSCVIDYKYKENAPVTILHTGGTTGTPKGVVLSNDNLNALAHQELHADIGFMRGDKWLNIMPPFIAYGVGNALHVPLAIGMQSTLIPSFKAQAFPELILKYKPSHVAGVPQYWESVINSPKMQGKDLSFMKSAGVGGDSMNEKLEHHVIEFFFDHNTNATINKGYGMTELSSAACACNRLANKVGSVGIPFIGNTITVFEPETFTELTYNHLGEICVTGPTIMIGYWGKDQETKQVIRVHDDNVKWVHTGDIGYITEDGLIYIVDRMKRMIIRPDGFKVYPSVIENVITKHDGVKSCAVIGVPCDGFTQGMVPKAYVVLKKEAVEPPDATLAAIKDLCHNELAEYAQSEEYEIIDKLPLTPIGKVDYRALESRETEIESI